MPKPAVRATLRRTALRRTPLRRTALVLAAGALAVAPIVVPGQAAELPEDVFPPSLSLTRDRAPSADGWYSAPVQVTAKATDNKYPADTGVAFLRYEMTGATTGSGTLDRLNGGVVGITQPGTTRLTVTAVDGNSNETTDAVDIRIDLDNPSAVIAKPDGEIAAGSTVLAQYTCADPTAGIKSCEGSVAAGAPIDTSTPGDYVFVVTATDRSGRTGAVTRGYHVYGTYRVVSRPVSPSRSTRVGEVLHATPGTFTPTPDRVDCTWTDLSGPIPGAADPDYTVRPSDLGATLGYRCTASGADYRDLTVESGTVAEVFAGRLPDDVVQAASLTGPGAVGSTLETAWALDPLAHGSVQWRRDGALLPAARGEIYVVTAADRGHKISASLVVTRPGYEQREYALGAVDITRGRLLGAAGPLTIGGSPVSGQQLTAVVPAIGVQGAATADPWASQVEWLRDGAVVGTGTTYVPSAGDVGRALVARVVASGAAFETLVVSSDPVVVSGDPATVPQGARLTATGPVRISGTARVGQRLTAATPTVAVVDGPAGTPWTSRVEWVRGGAVVATGATYVPARADAGRPLAVRLVAAGTGLATLVATSDAVTVASATPSLRVKARTRPGRTVRLTVLASAPGGPVTGRVEVRRGAKVVARGTLRKGRARIDLPRQRPGRVKYAVAYPGATGVAPGRTRATVRVR